jgi:ferritin-like metal-binding protein YciE
MGDTVMAMKMETLHDLFMHELKDVYDAEHQLIEALPKMRDKATDAKLKQAFDKHLGETQNHARRLEQVFQSMGKSAERKTCQAMKGIIREAEDMMKEQMSQEVMNAALISLAQKSEHYEITSYGCLATYAELMGHTDATQLLRENLSEEERADATLTQCAMTVNEAAMA